MNFVFFFELFANGFPKFEHALGLGVMRAFGNDISGILQQRLWGDEVGLANPEVCYGLVVNNP